MKTLLLLGTFALSINSFAQNVNIPDANFKAYLVGNTSINTNGDVEIQVSEASAFSGMINCQNSFISDLTGIEAFTALTELWCHNNSLTSIDINQNTALTVLYCLNNSLVNLNISQNTNLTYIECGSNSLTSLDISQNTALTHLICNNNSLISLDASLNTVLTTLLCYSNSLTSLNIANGNNLNISNGWSGFIADFNPDLTCIRVDDVAYSTANWTYVDATASFGNDCSLGINKEPELTISVYPNPATSTITINCKEVIESISFKDITGKTVITVVSPEGIINISRLVNGIYYLQAQTKRGISNIRFVKGGF